MLSRRAALEIPVVDYSAEELRGAAMPRKITLSTPREIRSVELLKPMGMTPYALAPAINVGRRRINEIVPGKGSIAADTALRLPAFFRTDAQSWINLQAHYDIERARESLAKFLKTVVPVTRRNSERDAAHL